MKTIGAILLGLSALGSAMVIRPLENRPTYKDVMMRVEKVAITCPKPHDPNCLVNVQKECDYPADEHGCIPGTHCIPAIITLPDTQVCPNHCPIHNCKPSEHYCIGGHDEVTGCPLEDYCYPKLDANGYAQECHTPCQKGEKQCPQLYNEKGTPLPRECKTDINTCPTGINGVTYNEEGCPVHEAPHCPNGRECKSNFCSEHCRNQDTCIPNTPDENGCSRVCPEAGCQIYEVQCPTVFDVTGCPKEPTCATHPADCPRNEFEAGTGCPIFEIPECTKELGILCETAKVKLGVLYTAMNSQDPLPQGANAEQMCSSPMKCRPPVSSARTGVECANTCPEVECSNGQVLCEQGFEKETGCPLPAVCMNECPDPATTEVIDERGCVVQAELECEQGKHPCEPIYDQNGCIGPGMCIPDDGSCECPPEVYDNNGCELDKSKDNEPADLVCGSQMNKCFMGYDKNGCGRGYECLDKICEEYPNCPLECPTVCSPDKQTCKQPDGEDGCPTPDICIDKTYVNSRDDFHDAITCPKHCSPICDNPCPVTYDHNGCEEAIVCDEPANCPASQYTENGCEVFASCGAEHQECSGGFDEFNCPKAPLCLELGSECPPACKFDEMLCDHGEVVFSHLNAPVSLGQVCIKKTVKEGLYNEEDCPNVCPPDCDWLSERAVFGGYDSQTGCKKQDKCIPKASPSHDGIEDTCTV